MFRFSRKTLITSSMLTAVIMTAVFALSGTFSYALQADNQRVITIHEGGRTFTVTTKAATISDVLDRADVELGEHDMVEPAKETPLIAPGYTVNVYRARPVTIVDGAMRTQVMSPYQSPRSIVTNADMEMYPEDTADMGRIDNFISETGPGLKVDIDRALPINLVLYGKPSNVRTQATSVDEFLKEKNITLTAEDSMSVKRESPIIKGMTIDIYRDGVQTKNEEQPVPFDIETVQDADREIGYKEIKTPGKNGKKVITYEIELKNGEEINRKVIQSVVTEQPKKQVIIVGAKRNPFEGNLEASFAALRQCESGGNYANKNNPTYRGAYQFGYGTWGGYGGYQDPADAPPAVQDQAAYDLYRRRGWQPWPHCSSTLGLQ